MAVRNCLLSAYRRAATQGHSEAITPNIFWAPPNFVVPGKYFIEAYNKNKNPTFLKMHFVPKTLKPGYEPTQLTCCWGPTDLTAAAHSDFEKTFLKATSVQ